MVLEKIENILRFDEDVLDEGVADWLRDKWNDVKAVTGIGTDSMGLGKNTEKGWKPKFNGRYLGTSTQPKQKARQQQPPGERVWKLD